MKRSALALVVVLVTFTLVPAAWAAGYARSELVVSTEELAALIGKPDVKIVDARGGDDYAAGHIPGAVSLPHKQTQAVDRGVSDVVAPVEKLEAVLGARGIAPTDTVVVYDDMVGEPVARVFWTLELLGHARVKVLNGGMRKWATEQRPVTKEPAAVTAVKYAAKPDWTRIADAAYVLTVIGMPGVAIVDTRSGREWSGAVASRAVKRAGRIPGAGNVDWEANLVSVDGVKVLKPADELAAVYAAAGATPDKEVVVYCRTGMRSSHSYLALRLLGYAKVRNYSNSMIEWGNRVELPIEK
jgi:thiosulfate/3-mercaptopyruvate sulfurtransferase